QATADRFHQLNEVSQPHSSRQQGFRNFCILEASQDEILKGEQHIHASAPVSQPRFHVFHPVSSTHEVGEVRRELARQSQQLAQVVNLDRAAAAALVVGLDV